MQRSLKFTKSLLYTLKRRFGTPGALYHIVGASDNVETGKSVINREKYPIKRLICLPVDQETSMFVQGTYFHDRIHPREPYATNTTIFIVDRSDLPDFFEPVDGDYIIVHPMNRRVIGPAQRYNIAKAVKSEDGVAYLLNSTYAVAGPLYEIIDVFVRERLNLSESTNNDNPDMSAGFPMTMPWDFSSLTAGGRVPGQEYDIDINEVLSLIQNAVKL